MLENHILHVCAEEKPELYQVVHLYFEDDHEAVGHWTGRYWWTQNHEAAPVYWQDMEAPEPHWATAPALHGSRN